MESAAHHATYDARIGVHECTSSRFVLGCENYQTLGRVEGFVGSAGEDDLPSFLGFLQSFKMGSDQSVLGGRPRFFILKFWSDAQNNQERLRFRGRRGRRRRSHGLGCDGESGYGSKQSESEEVGQ